MKNNEKTTYSMKEMIAELREEINKRFDNVDKAQAHTNGDVSALKLRSAFMAGAIAIMSVIVIPLIVYVWNQEHTARKELQALITPQYEKIKDN